VYVALQHKKSRYLRRRNRKGKEMNKVISLLTFLALTTPSIAVEYKSEDYSSYGYAAAASTFSGSGLKGGLQGSHVAANHHRENSYYPGFIAVPSKKDER